jgi:hypothetical protein
MRDMGNSLKKHMNRMYGSDEQWREALRTDLPDHADSL